MVCWSHPAVPKLDETRLLPVTVVEEAEAEAERGVTAVAASAGMIHIEFPGRALVSVEGCADPALRVVLEYLAAMIALPANTHIWVVAGVTDMRRGFTGLSALVQTALQQDPLSGQVFVFRGRRGDLIKTACGGMEMDFVCFRSDWSVAGLLARRMSGTVSLTRAQLSMLCEGIDWRRPVQALRHQWRFELSGC